MKTFISVILLFVPLVVSAAGGLPDVKMTPGETNKDVTQSTIGETICVKGWTRKVRPPSSYTNALKKSQIRAYRYADTKPADYEEDHLIPLELGGNPVDPRNLWPQPRNGQWNAAKKDILENTLKAMVCDGRMSLATARVIISGNWVQAYKLHVAH
jgi:hypothetical protein